MPALVTYLGAVRAGHVVLLAPAADPRGAGTTVTRTAKADYHPENLERYLALPAHHVEDLDRPVGP